MLENPFPKSTNMIYVYKYDEGMMTYLFFNCNTLKFMAHLWLI